MMTDSFLSVSSIPFGSIMYWQTVYVGAGYRLVIVRFGKASFLKYVVDSMRSMPKGWFKPGTAHCDRDTYPIFYHSDVIPGYK